MKVLDIPINRFIGIEEADRDGFILMLNEKAEYLNHIGTIHAAAQYALAEASSGKLYSTASISEGDAIKVKTELEAKGRTMIMVEVNILNLENEVTLKSVFEQFV